MKKNISLKERIKNARKGLNIYYYGKGKGKTTAVMGLAARAAGAGMNVQIIQFVKSKPPKKGGKIQGGEWPTSSEILFFEAVNKAKAKTGKVKTVEAGEGFVGILGDRKQRAVHVKAAKEGLALARKTLTAAKHDLVILDELVTALELELISEQDILNLIKRKPKHIHLAYTGHDSFEGIVEASDLVSEISLIKHPYYSGILAQRGIDF